MVHISRRATWVLPTSERDRRAADWLHIFTQLTFLLLWEDMSEGFAGAGGTFSMSLKPRRMDSPNLHATQLCDLGGPAHVLVLMA